ncbi:MAG: hypothetical protein JRJ57_00105 [Deltaproteobacteria bacterium]|nr:hypothetical protein [Deltaproteobacteria bacterium]
MGKNEGELVLNCNRNNLVRFNARHMPRLPDYARIDDLLLFDQNFIFEIKCQNGYF